MALVDSLSDVEDSKLLLLVGGVAKSFLDKNGKGKISFQSGDFKGLLGFAAVSKTSAVVLAFDEEEGLLVSSASSSLSSFSTKLVSVGLVETDAILRTCTVFCRGSNTLHAMRRTHRI